MWGCTNCNPRVFDVEAEDNANVGMSGLIMYEFKASLGYERYCLKKQN